MKRHIITIVNTISNTVNIINATEDNVDEILLKEEINPANIFSNVSNNTVVTNEIYLGREEEIGVTKDGKLMFSILTYNSNLNF